MKNLCYALFGVAGLAASACSSPAQAAGRPVDLVICLDTSSSMSSLLNSARARLWDVVNFVIQEQPDAEIRVGLMTYGSPGSTPGFVVQHSNLTNDLDSVYAQLMALKTTGGQEYVGWVLHDAVQTMAWADDPNGVRLVFVAGNESADQARERHDFRTVSAEAKERGIVISAIYAGNKDQGLREQWGEVSNFGGGTLAAIDVKRGTIQQVAPQDRRLGELNTQLNSTYVPYGAAGAQGQANQHAQDRNASGLGSRSSGSRGAFKGSAGYRNDTWDLVDAQKHKGVDPSAIDAAQLPAEMRSMSPAERTAYVAQKAQEREALKAEITRVGKERAAWLEAERKKQGEVELDSLDAEMLEAIGYAL